MDTKDAARRIRINSLEMTSRGGSSHVGSCFSIADILAVLYFGQVLRVDPSDPDDPDRDRFVLSKGHAGAAVYAALAEKGFFERNLLRNHYQDGSGLSGHVSHKGIAGVEVSTGSLGHGLGIAAGMALALHLKSNLARAFVLLSDGECDEGSVWEAALFAGHHGLDNLIAIIDYNKIQSLGSTRETLDLEPFRDKWESFGWSVMEVDGHDREEMMKIFQKFPFERDKPSLVIAHTVKGKGVSFMENSVLWHYRTALDEEFEMALRELEA